MTNNNLPSKIFQEKPLTEEESVLVVGYNESLIKSLPDGYVTIDPSISKIKLAPSVHTNGSFQTQDLSTFSLNKTFSKVLSLKTLHLCKDLTATFKQIQKHLKDEAIIYFPLKPNPLIEKFLEDEKWELFTKENTLFQTRSRSDVEDAVLSAPFESIMIEERSENISFYSENTLRAYLEGQLPYLTTLKNEDLKDCAKQLCSHLYKGQSTDEVLTLSSPWILLTLGNNLM